MKNGVVISDAGPIFSLAIIDKLFLLEELFDRVYIPKAVWEEVTKEKDTRTYPGIREFFQDKVQEIASPNDLTFVMDYGESEAVILHRELGADFLLIDDRKARDIAENLSISCIGTIGILAIAKRKGLVEELRPLFVQFLNEKRYYSIKLLNRVLNECGEDEIQRA